MIAALQDLLLDAARLGGPVVMILIALSVLSLSVVFYKLWQFSASGVGRHRELGKALTAYDAGNRSQAAQNMAASRSYLAPVVQMAMAGQTNAARLEAEAETRFATLERGFRLLDTIAQLSPLLGLFGTVLGMISAFQALQNAGAQVDPSVLAGGIWVALMTTAAGLIVAMPTAAVLSWFEARMDKERVFASRAITTILAPGGSAQAQDVEARNAALVPA